jgi:uncharacterized protein (TIGR02453 family)
MAFPPELFAFLTDLREHNDRDWFAANKERYERHVLEPALDFIEAFAPRLEAISPHFEAVPKQVGGSLFRIHRDTRFSKDKSPYKTTVGIFFRHERHRETPAPGFYLHVAPGECFTGAGIWHPPGPALQRIRRAIAAQPERWREVTAIPDFEIAGEALKRPPRGFDRDHPLIEDIKRKNFAAVSRFEESRVMAAGFVDEYARLCTEAEPFVVFLCDALELPS